MRTLTSMSDQPITISIKGKVGYEDEITVAQAAQIITFLNAEGENSPLLQSHRDHGAVGAGLVDAKASGNGVASAREALDLSGAKTNPEKIVALGQFVLRDGGESFKAEDVKAQFRRAREAPPGNFSRDLTTALREGWLAEAAEGEYYVTNKIRGIFDGDFKFPKGSSSGSGRGRPIPKAAKAKPEVFAEIDEFPTRMEGLASYSKMKSEKDRLLWVLYFAKERGVKGLLGKDLGWLTDHLGAGVPVGNISASARTAKSAGYLNRSTVDQTFRITEDGEMYLKSLGGES